MLVRNCQESKSLVASVFSKHEIALGMWFCANNEVTSNYSSPPAIVICLNASVEKHAFVLVIVHFRQVTLLSPWSINSLMFRIKLAI